MKVVFVYAEKDREAILADNFLLGVKKAGDDVQKIGKSNFRDDVVLDGDVYCMVGVKSLKMFRRVQAAGKHVLYFDKGYFRHRGPNRTWEYWRVCVDDHHPTNYIANAQHGATRWNRTSKRRAIEVNNWRESGGHIVYAGSSEKYHAFCGLPQPTEYAQAVIAELKQRTNRLIVYRPKPSWQDAVPIAGTSYSGPLDSIYDALQGAHCLVTNGSNSAFDAVVQGVPCIVLGNAITRPISSTSLEDIEKPPLADGNRKLQWLSNLAWCQFTEQEMAEGLAWTAIRPQFFGEFFDDTGLDVVHYAGTKPSKAALKKLGKWKRARIRTCKADIRRQKAFKKLKKQEPPDEWDV